MKIAVVSNDGVTISRHFGRARYYVVLDIENGKVIERETRAKVGHADFAGQTHGAHEPGQPRGQGHHSQAKHEAMAATIKDCETLIAGGMGQGAFASLQGFGIEPVITDVDDILEAVRLFTLGELPNRVDRLH